MLFLQSFPDRSLPYVLSILSKYQPISSEQSDLGEVVDLMNGLDPCLHSATPSVVVLTATYFRQLAGSRSLEVDRDIVERVKGQ